MQGYHKSVLLDEAMEVLIPNCLSVSRQRRCKVGSSGPAGKEVWYLDCTLGDGGHAKQILAQGGRVVGIDVDPEAIERVRKRFQDVGIDQSKFKLIQGNFRDIDNLLDTQTESSLARFDLKGPTFFAGAIFDLGVSSLQLENPERGFSFARMGPLDMRMDPSLNILALDFVNSLTRKELYDLFSKMGEEKYSWRLANALVRAREVKPFRTTLELADVVVRATRSVGSTKDKIHPATRVFQALRMVVNSELDALAEGLEQVRKKIERNGRIVVISFHSLEDRIVKNTFKEWEILGIGEILTKKPIMPSEIEIAKNPRSRSAKMRVFRVC